MILLICHGNVARSQFAEAFFRQKGFTDVVSAGTAVPPERAGHRLMDDGPTAARLANVFHQITGLDISKAIRTRVTRRLAEKADVIIVMTDRRDLPDYFSEHGAKIRFWEVDDPHDMGIDACRRVIATIRTRVDEWMVRQFNGEVNLGSAEG